MNTIALFMKELGLFYVRPILPVSTLLFFTNAFGSYTVDGYLLKRRDPSLFYGMALFKSMTLGILWPYTYYRMFKQPDDVFELHTRCPFRGN